MAKRRGVVIALGGNEDNAVMYRSWFIVVETRIDAGHGCLKLEKFEHRESTVELRYRHPCLPAGRDTVKRFF